MLTPKDRVSEKELRRRYADVRAGMREKGLDMLLVSGFRFVAGAGYLRYLTNWAEPFAGEVLLLPLEGEPVFFSRTGERALLMERYLGFQARTGSTAAHVAAVLAGAGTARVGLCSLRTMTAEFHAQLTAALPDVVFVEAGDILDAARAVKSEEEIGWVRKSAGLTDAAFQIFSSLVSTGRTEEEVFLEVDSVMKRLGAENTYFMMSADPHPVAKFLDLASDAYAEGDVVLFNAEVQGPGGYYTQLERVVSVGRPREEVEEAYAVCLEAERKGLSLLLPGVKASDVYGAVAGAIEAAGYRMGLHPGHSQGLDIFERPLIDPKEEASLSAGTIIVLHPHVLLPSGGGVWIGDTFLVTGDGPVALQESGKEIRVVS